MTLNVFVRAVLFWWRQTTRELYVHLMMHEFQQVPEIRTFATLKNVTGIPKYGM
jgi:hypothetical protein